MHRIGVLLSGRGSNFAAIMQAIQQGALPNTFIACALSNHANALGLQLAQGWHIPTKALNPQLFENRRAYDEALLAELKAHRVDVVVLAGYDRIIGPPLLNEYAGRILNIHPSLLPAYGGKGMLGRKVHEAVIEAAETQSGCTVHVVTDVVDGGEILGQQVVSVLPEDTADSLAARVLAQEHLLYPKLLKQFLETKVHHDISA